MDSGVNLGSCAACGRTLSAHINTSKPTKCKFVRKERKRELTNDSIRTSVRL